MIKTLNYIKTEEENLCDLIYDMLFFVEFQESEDDIKNGRLYTLGELRAEMKAKYESYRNSKS